MKKFIFFVLLISQTLMALSFHSNFQLKTPSQKVLITEADMAQAEIIHSRSGTELSIELKDKSAQRLKTYTATHIGEKLSIVVHNKLVSAPVIRAALEKKFVAGPMSEADAQSIVEALQHSP